MKIFHHDDQDGLCAAAIASFDYQIGVIYKQSHGELSISENDRQLIHECETRSIFVESDYSSKKISPPMVNNGEDVYILDYSFSRNTLNTLKEICAKAHKVVWIDHHLSSLRLLQDGLLEGIENLTYSIDMEHCGAWLTWEYFHPETNTVPRFIEFTDDYDCWKRKIARSDIFHIGFDMNISSPYDTAMLQLIMDEYINKGIDFKYDAFDQPEISNIMYRLLSEGTTAKKYIDSANREYYSRFHFVDSDTFGIECDCCNIKTNSWIFGADYGSYKLHCIFAFNGSVWSYSLYSNDPSIDCSLIAEQYGGGGHKGAAGFTTEQCLFKSNKQN